MFLLVNGNNQKWDGGGPFYWVNTAVRLRLLPPHLTLLQDGKGSNAGVQKPHPMMVYVIRYHNNSFFSSLVLPELGCRAR